MSYALYIGKNHHVGRRALPRGLTGDGSRPVNWLEIVLLAGSTRPVRRSPSASPRSSDFPGSLSRYRRSRKPRGILGSATAISEGYRRRSLMAD